MRRLALVAVFLLAAGMSRVEPLLEPELDSVPSAQPEHWYRLA